MVVVQLLALGWACLHYKVFLHETVDKEFYAILYASFTCFLRLPLSCYEFWLVLSADLEFMPMRRLRVFIHYLYKNSNHCLAKMAMEIMGLVWGRVEKQSYYQRSIWQCEKKIFSESQEKIVIKTIHFSGSSH